MAAGDDVLRVQLVAIADQYLATMRQAGEAAVVTGKQIQDGLGSSGYWAGLQRQQQAATGELIVSSRAWSAATRQMVSDDRELTSALGEVKEAVPKSGGAEEHGISSLTDAIRHMRSEGRMAGFIGRTLEEIGIAGGQAGRAVGIGMLAMSGGAALVLGSIELLVMGVGALVEHFKKVKEAEEEAKESARLMAVEMQKAVLEVGGSWEKFRAGVENKGLPEAIRQAVSMLMQFRDQAALAAVDVDSLNKRIAEIAEKQGKGLVNAAPSISVGERKRGFGEDEGGGIGISKGKVFDSLRDVAEYLKTWGDEAGKKAGEALLRSLEAKAKAEVSALAAPAGIAPSLRVETEEKHLSVQREVHSEAMRFAGEELRAATEMQDKLAEIDKEREKLSKSRGQVGKTLDPREAAQLQSAIAEADEQLEKRRAAAAQAGGSAIIKARQATTLQLQAIERKAAEVIATDQQRIYLQAEEQIAKLRAERALAGRVDRGRAAQLDEEIQAHERLRDIQIDRARLEAQLSQQAEVRTAMVRAEGLTADAIRQAEITGEQELASLNDRLVKAVAEQGVNRLENIGHLYQLIALQKEYNAEAVKLAQMRETQSSAAEIRAAQAQLASVKAGGTGRTAIEVQGADALASVQSRLDIANEQLAFAREQAEKAGAGEEERAKANVAAAERQVGVAATLRDIQLQINDAKLREYDQQVALTAEQMRQVGFDSEKQRALTGVVSGARADTRVAQSAFAAGKIDAPEFDRWTADIASRSEEAALLARRPWIRDFAGGVSSSFATLFREGVIQAKTFGEAMKAVGLQLADTFLGIGQKLVEKGIVKLATLFSGGGGFAISVEDVAQERATVAIQSGTVATQANTVAVQALTAQLATSSATGAASSATSGLGGGLGGVGGYGGLGGGTSGPASWFADSGGGGGGASGLSGLQGALGIAGGALAGVTAGIGESRLFGTSGIGGGIGGGAGAGVGAIFGGPMGAMIGGQLGAVLGNVIEKFGPQIIEGLKTAFVWIGNALKDAFQGVVGAVKDAAVWIGNAFMDAASAIVSATGKVVGAIGDVFSSIGGFFGGLFAEGGRPPVGIPSVGGEAGAEVFLGDSGRISLIGSDGPTVFVPKEPGTVYPADASREILAGLGVAALPRFEAGGRPRVGMRALGGERGPEVFLPDSALSSVQMPALGYSMPDLSTGGVYRAAQSAREPPSRRSSSASAPPIQLTYAPQITAMDGQDVKRVLTRHQTQLLDVIDGLVRRGRLGTS